MDSSQPCGVVPAQALPEFYLPCWSHYRNAQFSTGKLQGSQSGIGGVGRGEVMAGGQQGKQFAK